MIRRILSRPVPVLLLALVTGPVLAEGRAPEAEPAVAPERASARATMRTFLEAVNDAASGQRARLEEAVRCLDLRALGPGVRRTAGPQLAVDLKEILDRTRFVVLEDIPEDPEGPPHVFLRERSGEVVIAATAGGEWLFTESTVRSIPALLRDALQRERIAGVPRVESLFSPATWLRTRVPPSLRKVVFLLENWQWLGLLFLVVLGVILDRLLTATSSSVAHRLFRRVIPEGDTALVRSAVRPAGLLAMAMLWWGGVLWLGLSPRVLTVLLVAVKFLAATSAVWAAYRFTDILGEYFVQRARGTATRYDDLLIPLLRKSAKVFIVAFGIVFVADNLDVDISSLLAGLGLGGLAFALAAQDTVKNLFGSLTVLLDKPFHVGDWVVIGKIEGTVEEVGFRSTRIRTFYNSVITVPNANLIDTAVDNLGVRTYRRWKAMLSVTYDTPPEKIEAFCEGIRELVRQHPHTRKDYFHVYVNEYAPASLDILLYVFFQTPDWAAELRERHNLFLDILRLAKDLGVEFAFPTQTLHVHQVTLAPSGSDPVPAGEALELGRVRAREVFARRRESRE